MNEEHIDNRDYDHEDLEHVEHLLYANIHHDTGCDENQYSATNQSTSLTQTDQISGSNTPTDGNRKNNAPRRNAKRYWSSNTSNNTGKNSPNFVPYYKEKQSGIYKTPKIVTSELNKSATEKAKSDEQQEAMAAAPKQFTPYVSFLPFNDSTSNADEESMPVVTMDKANDMKVVKTNNDLIRKTLTTLTTKNINPFSKKATTDTYKQLLAENELDVNLKTLDNKKRLNPFSALSRKAKRKKIENNQVKSVRKNREELKQIANSEDVINVDEADKDDDDDVIILPTVAPPLICVDSSDDETQPVEHAFTEPTAVSDNRRKTIRCPSPSSSIQSADDFIAQNDQRTFGFDTFSTLSDEDLCHVGETVDNQMRDTHAPPGSAKCATIPSKSDNTLFTPPKQKQKQMHKDKTKTKRSYEVGANSFAAVDVYESESSDMPDSVYGKGGAKKRKNISDSDTSSVESLTTAKLKRFRKRKSSGSAKESDHMHSDDSSSDLPEVDDDTDDDDEPNENSYLVRGEALGKVKNANNKKKSKKNASDKRSEDDFINKLSSIVHGQDDSDENDEPDSPREAAESVEARDIVETVLQRRTKKSKKNQQTNAEVVETENVESNIWSVTDQVGETDELNLARVFDEEDLDDDSKSQNDDENPENRSASGQNESMDKELSEGNKSKGGKQQKTESSQANPMEVVKVSNTANAIDTLDSNNDVPNPEIGWNEEMRRFYHESWGGETFSVKNIRARMPRGFLNWMIINKDKYPSPNSQRGRQMRCLNCQEKGHVVKNCPKPPSKKRCYMCGTEGHIHLKCPNAICLFCGRKTRKFINGCEECHRERQMTCHMCKQRGHRQVFCPDKWRRYHSTKNSKTPLIREQKEPRNEQRKRYCCICAKAGHFADQCGGRKGTHLNMNIVAYRPCLPEQNKNQDRPIKYTILASDVDNYEFNFGNEVSRTGNTIYARFDRATNKNQLNRSTASDNDVAFVSEYNAHDTSDPPIEIYEDFDIVDDLDDVSSTDQFSENTQDDRIVTLDSFEEQNRSKVSDNFSEEFEEKEARIKQLDDTIETLEELKGKMLSHKQIDESNQTNENTDHDTTAESDQIEPELKEDITTSTVLPDFIPLSSGEPEKYEPARSPSPVSADSTTANERSDAIIHLTQGHCKHLLAEEGNRFLRDSEAAWDVSVRLEWRDFGNILIVNGTTSSQQSFHDDLRGFFDKFDKENQNANIAGSLPKKRDALIRIIRNHFATLDSPICNVREMVDVKSIYYRIRNNERNPSKANRKKNLNLRKQLNTVLFGRYGLGDGKTHLDALQDSLRRLINYNQINVPMEMRVEIAEHIDYIFSGNDHKNYENVIEHYLQLKHDNCLPPLNVDRKLLGLKINVLPQNDNSDSMQRRKSPFKNSYLPSFSRSPMPLNANDSQTNQYTDRMNTAPSSNDIQINVSTPSTSTSHFGNDWIRNNRHNNRYTPK